ncbi:MAG: methyl-accepting chemotaxis protein [Shimia sp.]
MSLPTDWRADPVVQTEALLLPLLVAAPRIVFRCAEGDADGREAWYTDAFTAAEQLEVGLSGVFDPTGQSLKRQTVELCRALAEELRRLAVELKQLALSDRPAASAVMSRFEARVEPAARQTLDAIRADFIGAVLVRQSAYAENTERAMGELSTVSRRIFFISINASIEAARAGETGRGFSLIAQEIRSLSRLADRSIGILRKETPE